MDIKAFKNFLIPTKSGVYFFVLKKEILYIGRATSLRDRVKSYFSKDLIQTRGPIILDMVFKANKIKYIVTDSVLEALVLEAQLIKKHQPKYNTKEKSDKSFNYVCITRDKLPKIMIVRGKNLLQKQERFNISSFNVFGPFTNNSQLKEALKIVRRIFPFLDEKSKNYMEFYKQINLVPDLKDHKLYLQNIKNIKLLFSGKKKQILKNLKGEMKKYSDKREFEKAGEIKRQIFALNHINDVALLKNEKTKLHNVSLFRIEAYDIAHMGGKNMVGVMTVVENNEINKSEYKKFKIRTQSGANDVGALKEVLERRLAHSEWTYPKLIVVDGGVAQRNIALSVLRKLGLNILVASVVKDAKHKPKDIIGGKRTIAKYKDEILLVNNEAHRFAISYHKNMRNKNFLK